jgi:16S rRNA processing protein RimM
MFSYQEIGRILKPFRNDGTLIAIIEPGYENDIKKVKAIFIRIKGQPVPFFIESLETDNELSYIKFEEFNGPEVIKSFNGSDLLLRDIDIKTKKKKIIKGFELDDLADFIISDLTSGKKVKIITIEQFPQQLMALTETGNSHFYIPLIENFITDIDFERKIIKMNLPEGIFNL